MIPSSSNNNNVVDVSSAQFEAPTLGGDVVVKISEDVPLMSLDGGSASEVQAQIAEQNKKMIETAEGLYDMLIAQEVAADVALLLLAFIRVGMTLVPSGENGCSTMSSLEYLIGALSIASRFPVMMTEINLVDAQRFGQNAANADDAKAIMYNRKAEASQKRVVICILTGCVFFLTISACEIGNAIVSSDDTAKDKINIGLACVTHLISWFTLAMSCKAFMRQKIYGSEEKQLASLRERLGEYQNDSGMKGLFIHQDKTRVNSTIEAWCKAFKSSVVCKELSYQIDIATAMFPAPGTPLAASIVKAVFFIGKRICVTLYCTLQLIDTKMSCIRKHKQEGGISIEDNTKGMKAMCIRSSKVLTAKFSVLVNLCSIGSLLTTIGAAMYGIITQASYEQLHMNSSFALPYDDDDIFYDAMSDNGTVYYNTSDSGVQCSTDSSLAMKYIMVALPVVALGLSAIATVFSGIAERAAKALTVLLNGDSAEEAKVVDMEERSSTISGDGHTLPASALNEVVNEGKVCSSQFSHHCA